MKKFLSIVMIFAVLLSCCACTAKNEGEGAAAPSLDPQSPEAMYGHIDQTVPMDGYYKIWNAEGVKFMMDNHPDGKFEILCNIDMQGATLSPIKDFTGTIKGGNFTISNFVLQGGDETDFGFVTVNKGTIQNFLIDQVTFLPGAKAKNIGSIAGSNEGKIQRCTVTGTLAVETAADGASCGSLVGSNTGSLTNSVVTVDVAYTASGAANVGGIVGTVKGGAIEFVDTNGKLDITGTNKTAGLFAGQAEGVVLTNCAFVGATNAIDGKLFTNFTGNESDDETVTVVNGLWRDNAAHAPLTEAQNALRDRVVQAMYEMGTVEWTVKEDLVHSCHCQLSNCHGTYNTSYTYYGLPYNHKCGSLARFHYIQNEDGTLVDWFYGMDSYDTFDLYMGNDCSGAIQQAWWTISNTAKFNSTRGMPSARNFGTIAVGDYKCDFVLTGNGWTDQYINANDEQTMYNSYAQMRKGDAYMYQVSAGGHARMAAEDPVIVRDQAGLINPTYSYVICHEQGNTSVDAENMVFTSWAISRKYTFANLYETWAIPVTCEELLTGEMEPAECEMVDGTEGFAGLFTGTVKANYYLDSVTVVIENAKGETVMDHIMFTSVEKRNNTGNNDYTRTYREEYDMASFSTALQDVCFEKGETYSYTVTANLATGDSFQIQESSFVYGQA